MNVANEAMNILKKRRFMAEAIKALAHLFIEAIIVTVAHP